MEERCFLGFWWWYVPAVVESVWAPPVADGLSESVLNFCLPPFDDADGPMRGLLLF